MKRLHFANINFEEELATNPPISTLKKMLHGHQYYLLLQFLPFLYADEKDVVLLSDAPPQSYLDALEKKLQWIPNWHLIDDSLPNIDEWQTWGSSKYLEKWAKKRGIPYEIPNWDLIRKIQAKEFAYSHCPKLPESEILENVSEAKAWLNTGSFPKVFKESFGAAGRGVHVVHNLDEALKVLQSSMNFPLIGEPFVNRVLDFSSQWNIQKNEIQKLGYCQIFNGKYGSYQGTKVGSMKEIFGEFTFATDEHEEVVYPLLQKIQQMGFLGHLGVDAMIYQTDQGPKVQPVVEINARKTMGYVALGLQKNHFPEETVHIRFTKEPGKNNLLPETLSTSDGRVVHFSKKLVLNPIF